MKISKILTSLLLVVVVATSCKKEKQEESKTPDAAKQAVSAPNDADGAMYSIIIKNYDTNDPSSSYDLVSTPTAWFGNATNSKDAGKVSLNGYDLESIPYAGFPWYFGFGFENHFAQTDDAEWTIEGNTANGINSFSHIDKTPFCKSATFSLPNTINSNNSYTINHGAATGNVLGIAYTVAGDLGRKDFTSTVANSKSYTITSDVLKSVASPQTELTVQVMVFTSSFEIKNGKKYYFIKQYAHSKHATIL
jgi:hypothetical protein